MKYICILFISFSCVSTNAQVLIEYNELQGNFVKEDIYNFSIQNRTTSTVEAMIKASIISPDEDIIFQFVVPKIKLETGNTTFNKDSIAFNISIDNYKTESIQEGFRVECQLLHPLDKVSVISGHSDYFIPAEVGLEKRERKSLVDQIYNDYKLESYYEVVIFHHSKPFETRTLIVGAENSLRIRVNKKSLPIL